MRAIHAASVFIPTHFCKNIKQGNLQSGRVINGKIPVPVVDDPIGWTFPHRFVDKQAIGSQLIDMRIIGSIGSAPRFNLNGDDLPATLNQVIWFAG